jgi:hypothetical protein
LQEGGTAVGSEGCGFRGFSPESGELIYAMDRARVLVGKDREGQATGPDGRKQLFGAVGGEDQKGVVGGFLQGFEESVCRLGGREAHPFRLEDQSDFERGSVRFPGEGVFQLADLGDRNPSGFRFWSQNKKVGMSLKIGIEKVGSQASSERFQFGRGSSGQEMSMGQAAFLGGDLKQFLNAGGRERHGAAPFGCGQRFLRGNRRRRSV